MQHVDLKQASLALLSVSIHGTLVQIGGLGGVIRHWFVRLQPASQMNDRQTHVAILGLDCLVLQFGAILLQVGAPQI